jgi:hypothetical protein
MAIELSSRMPSVRGSERDLEQRASDMVRERKMEDVLIVFANLGSFVGERFLGRNDRLGEAHVDDITLVVDLLLSFASAGVSRTL